MAELTFFFDRCFGTRFPTWLRKIPTPFIVEYHDEKKHGFSDKTADDEWLAVVGEKRWVVFSHDKRFHKDSMAATAVKQHKVACFYMDGGSVQTWDKMVLFAKTFLRVRDIVKRVRPPYIYRIEHTGRVIPIKGGWMR